MDILTLADRLAQRQGGILLYGVTPPKASHSAEKIAEIADLQMWRLHSLAEARLDGLVLYDVQDEADRTDQPRPFPFMETLGPLRYAQQHLAPLELPKVVYRAVGKHAPADLEADLLRMDAGPVVFVGAASRQQAVRCRLEDAYALRRNRRPDLQIGGATIPERHLIKHDEHLRMAAKVELGCTFFVSQCVYNVEAAKSLLSGHCSTRRARPDRRARRRRCTVRWLTGSETVLSKRSAGSCWPARVWNGRARTPWRCCDRLPWVAGRPSMLRPVGNGAATQNAC